MKYLKQLTVLLGVMACLASFSNCAGGKDTMYSLEQQPPFKVTSSYFQKWVAGVQEGGSGVNVYITIEDISEEIEVRNVYFRSKVEKAKNNPSYPDKYIAYFTSNKNRDVVMDLDPKKEAQNTPMGDFPFDLKENEAVISFFHKDTEKYFKISDIEEKPMIAYPSTNPNGID
ncbi:hypothetical protein POV27_13375 [Aureisphaera galaxeae]|uniref:hypothetical protein n=1 Tax=Aureisphaera galaxeae TaxID=1538023 RepID=UPI00234FC054|nr:hypothetical protein [Aureisphaera galaxeae]MDC8005047.1 hypothetical protein [Aureisphaera galaxeae]